MAELGNTNARLSTSVSLFVLPKSLDQTTLNNPAALLALATGTSKIGAIQSFTQTQRRNTDFRFELDSDKEGKPVERLPRTVDEYSIKAQRVMLYVSDALEVLGITGDDIVNNNAPIGILKQEIAPAGSGVPTKSTIFTGVWIHSVGATYNISGGDLRVLEDVDFGYTGSTIVGEPA
jgi:hypothetical protein